MTGNVASLIDALRQEADLSENGLDFMDDEDVANETRVQIGLLRDAADTTMPLIAALAVYGEHADLATLAEKARALNEAVPS